MNFPSNFPRIFHPEVYQGKRNPKNYFEGWYYKHVSQDGSEIWSIIFGVSHSVDPHSFIQIIEGKTGITDYLRFEKDAFSFDKKRLHIQIEKNSITEKSIQLDLVGEKFSIKGQIEYSNLSPFPQQLFSPGIMGWYTFAPFMECYHGVVSMNHDLKGSLNIGSKLISFSGGKGYIEKDWGKSMPSDWIWIQCNHFEKAAKASMMISVARIPWLRGHFPGFLSFVSVGGKVYRFATYNGSKIVDLIISESSVKLVVENKEHRMEIVAHRNISGQLKAPVHGKMDRKIAESLDAEVEIRILSKSGSVLFEDKGKHVGLEVVGDISKYI